MGIVGVKARGEPDGAAGTDAGSASGQVVSRPVLFERLEGSARVMVISAPAGSGKTVLLESWIREVGLADRAARVSAGRDERDPQRFWLQVLQALRGTVPGAALVQAVSAAPDLDGWVLVEGLLRDLAALEGRLWLVIDDVHELGPAEALRQLELLVMRAPPQLRFVLAARHDVRLGLHRLRLEGGLSEIRAADLRFSLAEAKELLKAAGVELPPPALLMLHERTEGWAAGLRLAALALAGHPDPEWFAEEFSGGERTVAEYLLAEVLDRQDEQVQRLLLRTSVLERVNGELADLLTGDDGGERVLQDLEQANAFVVSLDPTRSWFRYHQMFASLLQLELRRATPGEVAGLHRSAAGWFADHGFAVEAIRHAQAAQDWPVAARLLADHWPSLHLDGRAATVHELLAGFPVGQVATNSEVAVVAAADELAQGSLEAGEHYLDLAERGSASVFDARRGQLELLLSVVRLLLARQRGNLPAVAEEASRVGAMAESTHGQDLRALALISLGITEFWGTGDDTWHHVEQGVALARQVGRPYLEFTGLACQAAAGFDHSLVAAAAHARQAIELGERHGWNDEPAFGHACATLAAVLVWQGQLDEGELWLERAERHPKAETEPAVGMVIRVVRGSIELLRARDAEAIAAFQAAEVVAQRLAAGHYLSGPIRTLLLHALVHLGETELAEQRLAELSEQDREQAGIHIAVAALRLAQSDPHGALAALAPILVEPSPLSWPVWMGQAYLLEAVVWDALEDQAAAEHALERALDLTERDGRMMPFLLYPSLELLERHARRTAHAALLAQIQNLLTGTPASPVAEPVPALEPLSESELRVLRYLPTNLTAPEIARELYVSPNTVKTHIRNLYAKLGTHRRAAAVESARALGLLAPSGAGRTRVAEPAPR